MEAFKLHTAPIQVLNTPFFTRVPLELPANLLRYVCPPHPRSPFSWPSAERYMSGMALLLLPWLLGHLGLFQISTSYGVPFGLCG